MSTSCVSKLPSWLHSTLSVSDARIASLYTIQSNQHATRTMLCSSTLPRGLLPGAAFITQNVQKCTRSNIAARIEHMYGARMSVFSYLVVHILATGPPTSIQYPSYQLCFTSRCTLGLHPLSAALFPRRLYEFQQQKAQKSRAATISPKPPSLAP